MPADSSTGPADADLAVWFRRPMRALPSAYILLLMFRINGVDQVAAGPAWKTIRRIIDAEDAHPSLPGRSRWSSSGADRRRRTSPLATTTAARWTARRPTAHPRRAAGSPSRSRTPSRSSGHRRVRGLPASSTSDSGQVPRNAPHHQPVRPVQRAADHQLNDTIGVNRCSSRRTSPATSSPAHRQQAADSTMPSDAGPPASPTSWSPADALRSPSADSPPDASPGRTSSWDRLPERPPTSRCRRGPAWADRRAGTSGATGGRRACLGTSLPSASMSVATPPDRSGRAPGWPPGRSTRSSCRLSRHGHDLGDEGVGIRPHRRRRP